MPRAGSAPSHVRQDIREGFRWTWGHAPVRTLTLAIVTFNVTWGAAWSVLVLYSIKVLGMGSVGFGMLTSVGAIGGLVGTAAYDWLERRFSLAAIMRVGLTIETLTHLALAVNTSFAVALVIMFVFGAHAFVWGTTSRTVRMRAVPIEFQGRVASVYMVGVYGGLVVGSAVGGVIAGVWGVTAPFWFAFVGSAVILALIWRQLDEHRPRRRGHPGRVARRLTVGSAPLRASPRLAAHDPPFNASDAPHARGATGTGEEPARCT